MARTLRPKPRPGGGSARPRRNSRRVPARPRHRTPLTARLRTYLLAGILVTAPAGITLYGAYWMITFIDGQVAEFLPAEWNPNNILPFSVPGFGVAMLITFLILVGWFTAGLVGRYFISLGERLMGQTPIIRTVYGAIKQILETVMASQSTAFREVVLIEYPRRGLWAIAFVSGPTKGEVQNRTGDDVVNVFLPTTPNPTSGFLLFVPRSHCIPLAMTVEDGIKMVVSGGIVTPPDPRPPGQQVVPDTATSPDLLVVRQAGAEAGGGGPVTPTAESAPPGPAGKGTAAS